MIHSESIPRSRPKATTYSYAEKECDERRKSLFPQCFQCSRREREREREGERETDRETDIDRERDRHRQRDRERDRHRQRDRERETDRQRDGDRERERDTEREIEKERGGLRDRQTGAQIERPHGGMKLAKSNEAKTQASSLSSIFAVRPIEKYWQIIALKLQNIWNVFPIPAMSDIVSVCHFTC